ncbi:hypothetical protein [Maribellus mangrovi]|uniref:hypothetical protein n=1 Tax=Maribellus mangrovi TaxID=3133146 RepID=UPI0030ED2E68
MATLEQYKDCPVCNSPNCLMETNSRTLEEYAGCPDCGYRYVLKLKRDEEGNLILKDKEKGRSLDNFIPDIYELKNPYGSYLIKKAGYVSAQGSLKDIEEYNKFRRYIEKVRLESDISEVIIKRYWQGRFIVIKLRHGLLSDNDDLWEYRQEYGIQNCASCSYCENQMEDVNWVIGGEKLCPECFMTTNDQSERECIEAEIEYQVMMNQLDKINKQKTN